MKASELKSWPDNLSPSEWPKGVLEQMDADVISALGILRAESGVPMWPSSLVEAHVRPSGTSQHSTNGGKRLSTATDMHVSTHERLAKVFTTAMQIPYIGGIGLYFDTNTPMFHIDTRNERIVWVRVKGEYIYLHKDPVKFYKVLGEALCQ